MIKNTPYKPGAIESGTQLLRGSTAEIAPAEPLKVELGERQLLMSRAVMEDHYDCYRTVHPVQKHPANPLIRGEQPWECEGPTGNGSVLYDEQLGKLRMWTCLWPSRSDGAKNVDEFRTVYYESDDGIEWQRPSLSQVEYQGSRSNNIIEYEGLDRFGSFLQGGAFVFRVPASHRGLGRFGMVLAASDMDEHRKPGRHGMGAHLVFSEDGYRWKADQQNMFFIRGRTDSHQNIVWNACRQVFMYYRRATVNAKEIRRIAYSESTDLRRWTQPRVIIGPDELDTIYLYGMPVTRYQNMYLGLLQSLYGHADYDRVKPPKAAEVDVQLAWSHDGVQWDRHPQRPVFIETGPIRPRVPDWGMVYGMHEMIDVGERVHVYYGGCDGSHASVAPPKSFTICLGTLRRDGFVSLDAPREGWAMTVPMRCPGCKLHINAATAADGVVQVAIREGQSVRDGEWPEPWSLDHATDFTGDSVDHEVHWRDQQDLTPWKDKAIRLEFRLVKASLYSFWFA